MGILLLKWSKSILKGESTSPPPSPNHYGTKMMMMGLKKMSEKGKYNFSPLPLYNLPDWTMVSTVDGFTVGHVLNRLLACFTRSKFDAKHIFIFSFMFCSTFSTFCNNTLIKFDVTKLL